MKFRMTKSLRFWIDVEYEHVKNEDVISTRAQLIAKILLEFEEAGDAMRYLNADGQIAWKATPGSCPSSFFSPDRLLHYKHRDVVLKFLRDQEFGDAQFPRRPCEKLAVGSAFKLFQHLLTSSC
jgi:hypothetical protein